MDAKDHWETVYQTKAPNAVSWYRPHLEKSLELIELTCAGKQASIIDVGGGESTLVDDLLALGYEDISLLEISQAAIDVVKHRLGEKADRATWLTADVTQATLPAHRYDIWHDRAVFHFLTQPTQREAYLRVLAHALKPGGHVILATFGHEGPEKCSGLPVVRYDTAALQHELGPHFILRDSTIEWHDTPFGTRQQFIYCLLQLTG